MNPKVAVCHPAKQHSHRLAAGLYQHDLLSVYITGSPASEKNLCFIPGFLAIKKRIRLAKEIPYKRVIWLPIAPLFYFLKSFFINYKFSFWFIYFGDWLADYIYSFILPWNQIDIVVGYENACCQIFKKAKSKGKIAILDSASFHFSYQDFVWPHKEDMKLHEATIKRKKLEICLADHILTLSEIARKSYVDAGVCPDKVSIVGLGVDIESFGPASFNLLPDQKLFRFIFCGNTLRRKGFDILLAAWNLLPPHLNCEMIVVSADREFDSDIQGLEHLKRIEGLSSAQLADLFRGANCFVLPSRHDSFGMVVTEAMACGLPVIVSDHVGAKDLVVNDKNGWVIPVENVKVLTEKMKWCVEHGDVLQAMRFFCRETAEKNSWNHYQSQIAETINRVFLTRA